MNHKFNMFEFWRERDVKREIISFVCQNKRIYYYKIDVIIKILRKEKLTTQRWSQDEVINEGGGVNKVTSIDEGPHNQRNSHQNETSRPQINTSR